MYSNSQSDFMYNDGLEARERNCTVKEKRLTTMTEAVTTTTATMEEVERCECIELDLLLLSLSVVLGSVRSIIYL